MSEQTLEQRVSTLEKEIAEQKREVSVRPEKLSVVVSGNGEEFMQDYFAKYDI